MQQFLIIWLFALPFGIQQTAPWAGNRFIGTWHGTSTCVDPGRDTACKDEEVVYVVKGIRSVQDSVEMEAFKLINGKRVSMGAMSLGYSQRTDVWSFELATRVHALWSFQVKDSSVDGTLVELPSKRMIRNVHANRINE